MRLTMHARIVSFALLPILVAPRSAPGQLPPRATQSPPLGGTTWQLVRFQGGDGATLTPGVRSNYTISFGTDGRVSARLDCNRGNGTWTSAGANDLTFGSLATTRVACPSGSLYTKMARDWPYVRSYVVRNGHLFLSLMADAGIYEFEPMTAGSSAAASVRGTASYRERMALPRNAVLEVTLEDVTRTGALSEIVARIRNEQPGNPPIEFTISYDAGRIIPNHFYRVTARILVDDQVWFTTDRNYPVLTRGNPSEVQLVLRRTSGQQTLPGRVLSPPTLEDTYWKLTQVGNAQVLADERHPEANIVLHPANRTVTGSGGCNRMTARYTLSGNRLSFAPIAITRMGCVSGMDAEQAFVTALGRARIWRISGQHLELLDDRGNLLARLEAATLR